jgi:alkylation response protein AidB-like acyl-CoA dehydrogenase
LLSRIRSLGEEANRRSVEIEASRRLPADLMGELVETGFFRLWIPSCFGGAQADLETGLDLVEELGYHDGSFGWCAMIGLTTSVLAGFLPPEHAAAIYASDPRVVSGGFAAPVGEARPVDGGVVVSGHWQWGSAIHHCSWIGGGCRVLAPSGETIDRPRFVLVPRHDVEVLDTWFSSGLRGTGSTDYLMKDVFVPEGRWVRLGFDPPHVDAPLYRFPMFGLLALGIGAVSLGLARRALDELVGLAPHKRPMGSRRSLAERPSVQAQIAEAEATLHAARSFMRSSREEAWRAAEAGALTVEHRRHLRLAATHATRRSADVVDVAYEVAGGVAVYERSPFQRLFRDVHTATQHAMVSPRTWELAGRLAFGLETDVAEL